MTMAGLRQILHTLLGMVLLSGCDRSAPIAKEPPSADPQPPSWLERTPSPDEQQAFMRTIGEYGTFVEAVCKFQWKAQGDLPAAAKEFGSSKFQERVGRLSEPARKTIQLALKHMPSSGANTNGGQRLVATYSPVIDLLIVTIWTKAGQIDDGCFLTGSHYLSLPGVGRRVTEQFPDKARTQFELFIETYRRVANKIYSDYPMHGQLQKLSLPANMDPDDFEKIILARAAFNNSLGEVRPTAKSLVALDQWAHAMQRGDASKIDELLAPQSPIKGRQLAALLRSEREHLSVIFSMPWIDNNTFILILANPRIPALWYDLRVDESGKIEINSYFYVNATLIQS
jgi:hypothetical protein